MSQTSHLPTHQKRWWTLITESPSSLKHMVDPDNRISVVTKNVVDPDNRISLVTKNVMGPDNRISLVTKKCGLP